MYCISNPLSTRFFNPEGQAKKGLREDRIACNLFVHQFSFCIAVLKTPLERNTRKQSAMRFLLWVLIVALATLLDTAPVSAWSANSELNETPGLKTMAFEDQVRALSATPIGQPKRQLRRTGGDGENTNEAIQVNEDRGLLDGVSQLAKKLVTKLVHKTSILMFKGIRKQNVSPLEIEAVVRKTADPVKRAKLLETVRLYGLWYVQKADASTFKALYSESKLGPKAFYQAASRQGTAHELLAYKAMANRYREWVTNNKLHYF
ncbi:hypothetical protein ON010_g9245 [Phytophthora cinnamomi]|nr:hypothetical protein ON010_g9245 [Phytophthora cinnamomi]